jgi:four helix bundle protein
MNYQLLTPRGGNVQRFQDLKVWQRSHALVLGIYQLTKDFPSSERFGITSQLRRAAVSVPTNIAEGTKRLGSQDYVRFINIAEGSLAETEYLIMLSRDLAYLLPEATAKPLAEITEIARMLNALRARVEQGISVKAAKTVDSQ